MSDTPRSITDVHWCYGGTFITNFQEAMRPIYQESVKRFEDDRLVVAREATHHAGKNYGGSLHWVGALPMSDLGPFWRLFDAVRELSRLRSELEAALVKEKP